jgi:hypothetical protein
MRSISPRKLMEALRLLTSIPEVFGSNLGTDSEETDYEQYSGM